MDYQNKTNKELISELEALQQECNSQKEFIDASFADRQQTIEQLRASEVKFRNIFEHSIVAISITAIDGKLTTNKAFCQMLGYKEDELLQLTWRDITHPDDLVYKEHKNNALVTGKKESLRFESRYLHKNGTIIWADINTSVQRDNNGYPQFFISIINDITIQKNTEELLRESESKFRNIYEKGPYGIALVSNEFIFLIANNTFCQIVGYTEEELQDLTFRDITYIDDINKDIDNIQKLINKELSVYKTEKRYTRKDGKVIWCFLTVTANYRSDGEFLYNVAILTDITERKEVEFLLKEKSDEIEAQNEEYVQINEELNQANEELVQTNIELFDAKRRTEKSEDKFRKVFLTNPDSITINRLKDGLYTSVNHGFSQMLHYTEEEVIGKTSIELNIWETPEERNHFVYLLQKNGFVENLEAKLRTKNGSILYCLVSTTIIELEGFPYILSVTKDISERKKMEDELIKAKNKAEESDRLKTAFLQNMSHEIRTPMNAIMGFSALLIKNYNNKPKLGHFSQIINQRCADLLDIINEILDVAKIESGQLPICIEECNLDVLFSEISLFFKETQKRQNKQHITFNMHNGYGKIEPIILADKVKLKQILINLIGNAFKFTEKGTIQVGYSLDEDNKLLFFVSDTGIGIPEDKREFIFERFAQVEQLPGYLYGGTGLGLSIVKGLVNLLGGEIWLTSEMNKGTTFYVKFPYQTIKPTAMEPLYTEINGEFNFSNKTLLIVEDDQYNLDYLVEVLDGTGINIIHSFYGHEAVNIATSQELDIVLMDIRLPDIDGYTATQLIRKSKPYLIIIAQTAYAAPEDKEKAIHAGCNDYISKPIDRELLLYKIQSQILKC